MHAFTRRNVLTTALSLPTLALPTLALPTLATPAIAQGARRPVKFCLD